MVSSKTMFTMFIFLHILAGAYSTTLSTFTVINNCNYPVWPGISSVARTTTTTGFFLPPSMSANITVNNLWNGTIWARTNCSYDSNGNFSCLTGNCASGTVECEGGNAAPPTTLAKLTLNGTNGLDLFKVTLVEGFNLPITVEPQSGNGASDCTTAGCQVDLNGVCPMEQKVIRGKDCVACRSACKDSKHCFPEYFSNACPRATVVPSIPIQGVCTSTDYHIIFCASSMKAGKENDPTRVDKTEGQKKWSTKKIIKIVGISLSSILSFLGVGYIAIKIRITCSSQGCKFSFSARARPSSTALTTLTSTNT